jgi:hypothetical protein
MLNDNDKPGCFFDTIDCTGNCCEEGRLMYERYLEEKQDETIIDDDPSKPKNLENLNSDKLFNELIIEMKEYCSSTNETTLEDEIQYLLNQFKKYNYRRKTGFTI